MKVEKPSTSDSEQTPREDFTSRPAEEQRRTSVDSSTEQAEAYLAAIVDSAEDAILSKDLDGIIRSWNAGAQRIFGYEAHEVIGQSIRILIPEDRAAEEDVILQRLRNGERIAHFETIRRTKDGRDIEVSLTVSPVRDATGAIVGASKIARDITAQKRTARELAAQQAWFRITLGSIGDGVIASDVRGTVIYLNETASQLTGWAPADAIGRPLADVFAIVNETTRAPVENPADIVLRLGQTVGLANHTVLISQSGHETAIADSAAPIRNGDGSLHGVVVVFRDAGEERRHDRLLRESEERLRQLADAMPQIVWTADASGNIDYLNQRWTELTGLPANVSNDAWSQFLHPDDAAEARARWATSIESGTPFETQIRLLDRRTQNYRWHLIRTVPARDEDGRVSRWFGSATDIEQQKTAEASLRFLADVSSKLARVREYEPTLQQLASLAVPFMADWAAVHVSEGDGLRRLAVAHEDPEKIRLAEELMREYPDNPDSPAGVFAVLRTGAPVMVSNITDDMLAQGARDARHLELIRALGLRSYMCVPLTVSGKVIGALTFATAESGRAYDGDDLTLAMDLAHRAGIAVENTQLYQALRDADQRKDEFLATLAHELRNPLAPIRNALEILRMPRAGDDTLERARSIMERQVQQVARLVDDLLDVSRVMGGKVELRRAPMELAAVIARAVETAQPLIDAQGHTLSVRVPAESMLVHADGVRLSQVLSNLLANAAKYTDPGGRITVTAVREVGRAAVRIQDNGIGLDREMLNRIFDLFIQTDQAKTRAQGGLGVGLTLARTLVEMHQGTIEAHSPGIGLGSVFTVRLPLMADDTRVEAPHERTLRDIDTDGALEILVVDDNRDAAESLAILLRSYGHRVETAFSGSEALELASRVRADIAFLDIGMPHMDGHELARRLRQRKDVQPVLVALTGWGQHADRQRSAAAGFDHHVVKPMEPQRLAQLLEAAGRRGRR